MANLLVKPVSESNGNLVILADNTSEIHLIDLQTGEVIESGKNVGPSNGRDSTVRFSKPGGSYQNVGVMDDKGNVLLSLRTAGDRVQFNYNDYDALIKTPVSTIEGYRWDNSRNVESVSQGGPSNADIARMPSEEYDKYLESQKNQAGQASQGGGATGIAGTGLALAAPSIADAVTSVNPIQELGVMTGMTQGPLTETQAAISGLGEGAGSTLAAASPYLGAAGVGLGAYGMKEAFEDGDPLSGALSGAGAGVGASMLAPALGMSFVPGIGWVAAGGALLGAGLGLMGGHVTTQEQQAKNWGRVSEGIDPNSETGQYLDKYQRHVQDPNNPEYWAADHQEQGMPPAKAFEDMNALDLTPGLGFFESFGTSWLEDFTEPQRIEIARRAKEEGLVRSDRGDILVDDKDRLRQIGEEVRNSEDQYAGREQFGVDAPAAPEAFNPNQDVEPTPRGGVERNMVPSQEGVEPPISGYQQIDGANLPPPGPDPAALAALSFIQSAPSQAIASQLTNGIFQQQQKAPITANFEQLQGAFR